MSSLNPETLNATRPILEAFGTPNAFHSSVSATPWIAYFFTLLTLRWTLTNLGSSSPLRPVMLAIMIASTCVTWLTAHRSSSLDLAKGYLGMAGCGQLVLEMIDSVCLSRRSFDAEKGRTYFDKEKHKTRRTKKSLYTTTTWTMEVLWNKRKIGTPKQFRNVPPFDITDPSYVPSKARFLTMRTIRCVASVLALHLITEALSPEAAVKYYAPERVYFIQRMFQGRVSLLDLMDRVVWTAKFWVTTFLTQRLAYDIVSIECVGIGLHKPQDWPNMFGPVLSAVGMGPFWSSFWHQCLRQPLTSNTSFITHDLLRLPKRGMVTKYAKVCISFFLSGSVHAIGNQVMGVPFRLDGWISFFTLQTVAIMIEDLAIAVYRRLRTSEGGSAKAGSSFPWGRVVGYVWVAVWLIWVTPIGVFPERRFAGQKRMVGSAALAQASA